MSVLPKTPSVSEELIVLSEFMKSYNQTIPEAFPRATTALLVAFKDANQPFFKNGELWSLDLHRKKVMDWLPMNSRSI
jgi:hypothetical protein